MFIRSFSIGGGGGSDIGSVRQATHTRASTTAALPASTYNNTAGTITGNAAGALPAQDGITLSAGQRLLVKNQGSSVQNGVYAVTTVGTGLVPFVLTRTSDFNSSANIIPGSLLVVAEGTLNADTLWELETDSPIVVGTSLLTFRVLGSAAGFVTSTRTITAGAGMTGGGDLSADRTLDVVANADGSITVNANDIQVGVLATDAQHGARGGGTQHADATALASGFMSASDFSKVADITGTTNVLSKFTAGDGLQDSSLTDDGTTITRSGDATTIFKSGKSTSGLAWVFDTSGDVSGGSHIFQFKNNGNRYFNVYGDSSLTELEFASPTTGSTFGKLQFDSSTNATIYAVISLRPFPTNTVTLGDSTHTWKDLFLGGVATLSGGGSSLSFTNGTSNRATWGTSGSAVPSFTSYSAGTKLVLSDTIAAANAGYTMGISSNAMWFTVASATSDSDKFEWYAGTTSIGQLRQSLAGGRSEMIVGSTGQKRNSLGAGVVFSYIEWDSSATNLSFLTASNANVGAGDGTVIATLTGGVNAAFALNGTTSNKFNCAAVGAAAPTFTTYSAGVKHILFDNISGSSVGYSIGVESGFLWYANATSSTTVGHKWYGGTTEIGSLTGGASPEFKLAGSTSNRTNMGAAGLAGPTFTTYSAGVKHIFFDGITGANAGYTQGVESGFMWFGVSVSASTNGFKWYGGTTLLATLAGGATPELFIEGSTGERINLGDTGVAAPTFTSYSAGVKTIFFDSVTGSAAGYTQGVESGFMFFTGNTSASGFKFYGGVTEFIRMTSAGLLVVNGGSVDRATAATLSLGDATATAVQMGRSGQSIGFFGTAPTTKQTSGANLTNNVTSGGTDNTVDDVVAAAVDTSAASLTSTRNAAYQLARKLKQVNDALRLYGLLT